MTWGKLKFRRYLFNIERGYRLMAKLQRFINDTERVCDNPECQKIIPIGGKAVKKIYRLRQPDYFHEKCVKVK